MYESEINSKVEAVDQIPAEVLKALAASRDLISYRTVLPWGEHCTECVWPTCYSTCDLYEPRPGGNCRRFVDGMVRIDSDEAVSGYLLKIRFKQWGKLWAVGNTCLYSIPHAKRIEIRDRRVGSAIQTLIMPTPVRSFVSRKRYSFKKRAALAARPSAISPSSFMLECYNPGEKSIRISLTIRSQNPAHKFPYQSLLEVQPGFNRINTPFREINDILPLEEPFNVELIPNDFQEGTGLYFGIMEFVREVTPQVEKPKEAPKIKCVIWDLDNTLWDGVLIEDGSTKLSLKPGIREVIEGLDRRGILQSVASKNHRSDAMEVLRSWNLAEYFLFPEISWNPKSASIASIVQQMNLGAESVLFIDDSPFELEQVRAVLPEVQVLKAEGYKTLLSRPEFDVPVTAESTNRRKLYQVENTRQATKQSFGENYKAFLEHCEIRLTLSGMTKGNIERVHELTQRTNQMNFSGNRYDRSRLEEILQSPPLDTYVIKCEDKFGSYGVVGFAIVDKEEPRLTDLMFSCRIQAKRVEHAFLAHIIHKYTSEARPSFFANFRKTPRNEPSGRVFADMGFHESELVDGVSRLTISRGSLSLDDRIIRIEDESNRVPA
jgi:FkbH-like protein